LLRRLVEATIRMMASPRITRLTLVPHADADDSLRRYRLARLDEVALASPPDPSAVDRPRRAPVGPQPPDDGRERPAPAP
jgi:hypothetical protein